MSSSRHFPDGRRQKQAPEKSNFAQTCNLLSQYMKEKGTLRNLNLEIGGKVESLDTLVSVKPGSSLAASASTSIDLNTNIGKSAQAPSEKHSVIVEDDSNKASTSKEKTKSEHENAQLTIFYSGRVLVFDDYPVGKVRELVSIAKKGSSQMSYGILSNTIQEKTNSIASTSGSREGLPPRPQAGNGKQPVGISSNTCQQKIKTSGAMASSLRVEEELSPRYLPIARRSSLNRFLEKRKDRYTFCSFTSSLSSQLLTGNLGVANREHLSIYNRFFIYPKFMVKILMHKIAP
ncbi:protein tify 10a [Phtheirospermum japonicum]|uniref:Protein TIFY n=1 Tax=Phtheirospermum japonicum TaxID=374723 RepID=A0A830BW49_9LAMI|nr:protein tify 10a [Phtheirospermum japonicum]